MAIEARDLVRSRVDLVAERDRLGRGVADVAERVEERPRPRAKHGNDEKREEEAASGQRAHCGIHYLLKYQKGAKKPTHGKNFVNYVTWPPRASSGDGSPRRIGAARGAI
jgi:hypothetical protein